MQRNRQSKFGASWNRKPTWWSEIVDRSTQVDRHVQSYRVYLIPTQSERLAPTCWSFIESFERLPHARFSRGWVARRFLNTSMDWGGFEVEASFSATRQNCSGPSACAACAPHVYEAEFLSAARSGMVEWGQRFEMTSYSLLELLTKMCLDSNKIHSALLWMG